MILKRVMSDRFKLSGEGEVNVIELHLPVHVDHAEFDKLNEAMSVAVNEKAGGKFVADLSAVEYTGSAVLGCLVNLRQQVLEAGGTLMLCGISPRLSGILHTCSLDRLFKTAATRAAAVKSLG